MLLALFYWLLFLGCVPFQPKVNALENIEIDISSQDFMAKSLLNNGEMLILKNKFGGYFPLNGFFSFNQSCITTAVSKRSQKYLNLCMTCAIDILYVKKTFASNLNVKCRRENEQLKPLVESMNYDVAIVGGGLAGLCATIEIFRKNHSVVLIEKNERLGGNSAKASSGINAVESIHQKQLQIDDNIEKFISDTVRSGKGKSNPDLIKILAKESANSISFLEEFGISLSSIVQLGGHTAARSHRAPFEERPVNVGWKIMSSLINYVQLQQTEKIKVLTNTEAIELIQSSQGNVSGLTCKTQVKDDQGKFKFEWNQIKSKAVILTTGGYASDKKELIPLYAPHLLPLPVTTGPFSKGEGIKMAEKVDAMLVDMEEIQVHPTAFVDPTDENCDSKILAPEALRGCGGILVAKNGERFVDELSTRDDVTNAILQVSVDRDECMKEKDSVKICKNDLPVTEKAPSSSSPPPPLVSSNYGNVKKFLVMNEAAMQKFGLSTATFYLKKGLIKKYDDVSLFCKEFDIPKDNFVNTLKNYGRIVPDPFGKTTFPVLFNENESLYVAIITPALHYCMGGLGINKNAQVLSKHNKHPPIKGLYAAGEVTGGVHGKNRLGGNSLLECVVFGRIAANSACSFLDSDHYSSL